MADQQPYSGTEIEAAIKILREDAQLAHNRAITERLDKFEQRLERIPVAEMTAEEKAAAYDKLMAGGGAPPAGPGAPPAPGAPPGPPGAPGTPPGTPPPPPPANERKRSAAEDQVDRSWWSMYQKEQAQ